MRRANFLGLSLIHFVILLGCSQDRPEGVSNAPCVPPSTLPDVPPSTSGGAGGTGTGGHGQGGGSCASVQWENTIQIGTSDDDEVFDIDVDGSSRIYIAGRTSGSFLGATNGGQEDILLVALDPSGEVNWSDQRGSPEPDSIERVTVAPDGSILACGSAMGDITGMGGANRDSDSVAMSYTNLGKTKWITQWGSPEYEKTSAIEVNTSGETLVVGYTLEDLSRRSEIFVRKIDAAGKLLPDVRIGTTLDDVVARAAMDRQGNLHIAGGTSGSFGGQALGSFDVFIAKLGPTLETEWIQQIGTADVDGAQGVGLDDAGNTYIAAVSFSDLTNGTLENDGRRDAFIIKYDAAGMLEWVRRPVMSTDYETVPWDIVADEIGNVYMVGWTEGDLDRTGNKGGKDAFVLKVDSTGTLAWIRQFGTSSDDEARAVVVDRRCGYVLVAGSTGGEMDGRPSVGGKDIFVVAFDFLGTKL